MLSFCNVSAAQAENYYQKDDYYTREEAPQSPSYWTGKGATTLGLEGAVDREVVVDLLHGLAPDETFLLGRWVDPEKHRAATDYTFSAPKSVSIAALVQEDDRVLEVHTSAVETALSVLENRYAQTRISTDQGRQRITTGNLIAAVFPHNTSRELEPQLHSHCVVINATQLPDGQWRSFSNEEAVQNQKLLGQIYQNELAHGLKQLGYEIEPKAHGQFEIEGYSPELLGAFSTRRHQIEELIKTWETERIPILDGNGNAIESRSARYEAAALRSRQTKPPAVDRDKLQRGWSAFLKLKGIELPAVPGYDLEHNSGYSLESQSQQSGYSSEHQPKQLTLALDAPLMTADLVIDLGIEHCSERESVFRQTKLERFVFENHLGQQPFNELEAAIQQSTDLIQIDKQRYTTQSALHLELNTIRLMQQGQGKLEAIAPDDQIQSYLENKNVTEGQQGAINLAIATGDQVIAIQGVAGAGKSYALDSVRAIAQAQGYEVKGYAPSAEAASVLGEAIGIPTETISRLLVTQNQNDAEQSQPQLWIVDEAGLLSMKQAHDLLEKSQSENARVILVGDRRQLSAVEAGNPFKSLQAGGIATARLDESLRQKTQDLRIAVKAIAQGNISAGVQLLDQAGCIIETNRDNPGDQSNRLTQLVRDYTNLSPEERNKTLLLAGTNRERQELTQQIRTTLQAENSLGQNHLEITGLRAKDMTSAQSQYVHSYEIGDVVVPHQNYKKQQLEKNQQYRVVDKDRASNQLTLVSADGNEFTIDPSHCLKKSVYQPQDMEVAVGDRLRWSKNDAAAGIRNGQTFKVLGFEDQQTQIEYADGKTDLVNLNGTQYVDYAWVSTTYSAQGKTAERVLATTDRTLNQEAFYVICSRAKYQLNLYTDDKAELLRLAQVSKAKENVSDYLKLPALVSSEISQLPTEELTPEITDFSPESRRTEQEPSPTEPTSTDRPGTSHDSILISFDPERLRTWITDRLRTPTAPAPESGNATSEPAPADLADTPTAAELTAAISRLDFSAPALTTATDNLGAEAGWDEQTGEEQPSPDSNDPQPARRDSAVESGRTTGADREGDRTVDSNPEPTSASTDEPTREPTIAERLTEFAEQLQREVASESGRTAGADRAGDHAVEPSAEPARASTDEPAREPTIAERLTEFAEQLQREVASYGNRASSVEPTIQPADPEERSQFGTPEPGESNANGDLARDENAQPEVTPSSILAAETGLGGGDLHVPRLDSADRDGGDLRDRLFVAVEPVSTGDADPDQWAGEQHREAAGAHREEVAEPVDERRQVEPQIDEGELEQQHQWAEYAFNTAVNLLNTLGVHRNEGQRYIAQYDEESQVLTIEAKDGRGEILRTEASRLVESSLKAEDIQVFERLNQRLEEQRQVQRQMEREQARERSRGFELG
jgi:conjugative relaxase-like TrwC/TraI family protein